MPFEEFDKKIKEASEHYHPAYDETAWKKMNHLLEDQLPEKKDDWRRIYFLLFFLIFITGGVYLLVEKPWNSQNPTNLSQNSIDSKLNPTTKPAAKEVITSENKTSINNQKTGTKEAPVKDSESGNIQQSNSIPSTGTIVTTREIISVNKFRKSSINNRNTFNNRNIFKAGPIENKSKNNLSENPAPELIAGNKKVDATPQKSDEIPVVNTPTPGSKGNQDDKKEIAALTPDAIEPPLLTMNQKKPRKSFISNLAFTVSAGPDVSSTPSSERGKTTLYIGGGLRYDLSKRFSIRTGFYITNKVYTAPGKDYKLTYNNYPTYTLTSVNAECKIFEVPLIVNYNFIQRKKGNLFGVVGISSILMNREEYHYHYTDSWGRYQYGAKTYEKENNHYFSVVTLAAGYERKLNNILSISAEPYVKLPLSGIGAGKIKLNSTGFLVTLNVRPFAEKDKK